MKPWISSERPRQVVVFDATDGGSGLGIGLNLPAGFRLCRFRLAPQPAFGAFLRRNAALRSPAKRLASTVRTSASFIVYKSALRRENFISWSHPVQRESILRLLRERIVAFAASRYGRDVAEDVAQEALTVLHEKYQQVTELEDLGPLALQIARFKMLSLRRKVVRRGEHTSIPVEESPVEDPRDDPERQFQRQEMLERLTAAISKLGDRCRQLMRYKLESKGFAEIQRLMKAGSINTVYTWDLRCRKHLMELMGGAWEQEDKK